MLFPCHHPRILNKCITAEFADMVTCGHNFAFNSGFICTTYLSAYYKHHGYFNYGRCENKFMKSLYVCKRTWADQVDVMYDVRYLQSTSFVVLLRHKYSIHVQVPWLHLLWAFDEESADSRTGSLSKDRAGRLVSFSFQIPPARYWLRGCLLQSFHMSKVG